MSPASLVGEFALDPTSDEFLVDAGSAFLRAREAAGTPVFHDPVRDLWVVSTYDGVSRALPDFRSLSHTGMAGVPVPERFRDRIPEGFFADSWIALDPPEHTMPRRVANRGFTRPQMAPLEPRIAAIAAGLIDEFVEDGAVDLMQRYCFALTTGALTELFGLPALDEPVMRQAAKDHIKVMNDHLDPLQEPERSEVWGRYADAWDHLRATVAERAENPGSDIISVMAGARGDDGEPLLPVDRVILHVVELAFAGTDTTANLMANAVVLLSRNPEQLDLVRADPTLWAAVVEETVRRFPSVQALPRTALTDVEIEGVIIPAGSRVWLAVSGANNDPAHYEHPERFDVMRPRPDAHLAFGKGTHFCMGAPLARLQARIGLQTLYARIPELDVVPGHELDFVRVTGAPSRTHLPVTWSIGS